VRSVYPLQRGDSVRQPSRGNIEGGRIDVYVDRRRPQQLNHFSRCNEGERTGENRIARADSVGHQSEQERIGSGGAGNRMLHPHIVRKRFLELLDFRAHDVLPVVQNGRYLGLYYFADPLLLRFQIDKIHVFPSRTVMPISPAVKLRGDIL
jgi:hypothetical protein